MVDLLGEDVDDRGDQRVAFVGGKLFPELLAVNPSHGWPS
jgi:hypothetical protein